MNMYAGMDEKIVMSVKRHAKNLKRTNVLRSMEIDDIEQELMCEVLLSLPNFDEQQGTLEHFIRKVLERRSVNLLRVHLRAKRGPFVAFKEYADNDNFNENVIAENTIALHWVMDYLPSRYKALCKLLTNHSVNEAAEILGKNRASLYRDLRKIACLVRLNSENQFLLMFREGVHMQNLSILEILSAKEISRLEVGELMDLSDQITKFTSHTKELKEKLEDGLNLRFSEAVKNSLRSENKDTGTIRFFDGTFQIVAEVSKKVSWDQEKMEELIKRIPDERRKDIVKISYAIEERKYSALPTAYQELFREARTITPGKTRFQITIGEQ
jgi:DNA-directed RNA polymerase specialized sigma24 family protein